MARFHGKVGFGATVEQSPGVYVDEVTEYAYFGDFVRTSRQLVEGEKLNKDISAAVTVSIMADATAHLDVAAIRYVEWLGKRWVAASVEVQRPRLLITLGEVYNGPTPGAPESP